MNDLKPVVFLIPVIALILAVIAYRHFYKKTENKSAFRHFIFLLIVLAFLLNLTWELVQAPLYANFTNNKMHIIFCVLASGGDVIMLLLLYFVLAFIYKDPVWISLLTILRILVVILIGGIGAILSELGHVLIGSWTYTASMPLIPVVKVGLSPVLQFIVIPITAYYLSFRILKTFES